jgi:glycosyltransferase involved in cell wall biosynthesis
VTVLVEPCLVTPPVSEIRPEVRTEPLVSIVISNFNYERYVGQAIEAALNQTYPSIEVIVVDDGSTDASRDVIKGFDDPRLKALTQENQGQASAINNGFDMSSGEIVLFVDSDDLLKPSAVAEIVANWEPGLSHLQFPLELIDQDGCLLGLHPFSLHMEDGDIHWQMVVGGNYRFMPTTGNAFSRSAVRQILPMPATEWRICADTYLTTTAPKSGRVKNLKSALGLYRIHALNNWYSEVRGEDKKKTIWRNHVQTWRALIKNIRPQPGPDDHLSERAIRDRAALYHWRRILIGQRLAANVFTRRERRSAMFSALNELACSSIPARNKLLYLAFIAFIGAGAWKNRLFKSWLSHPTGRPSWVKKTIELLKGQDFYSWMRMRRQEAPLIELPLGVMLRFGRNGAARALQWYGWTRSDQYLDWCIGSGSALVCLAPETKRNLLAEFEVLPYTTATIRGQRLEIFCNGEAVYTGTLTGRAKVQVELPSKLWQPRSRMELRFNTPDFAVPRLVKEGAEDYRPLSVAFTWIKFSVHGDGQRSSVVRHPLLPVGDWLDLTSTQAPPYLTGNWRRAEDSIPRMTRKVAHMRCSVLEPSAGDHLLSLDFAPEPSSCPITVSIGEIRVGLDLSQRSRADILLGRGTISKTGELVVSVGTETILGSNRRGFVGDQPAGPGLTRVRLQQTDHVLRMPTIQSGAILDFRLDGNGQPYLQHGWYPPDGQGATSSDTVARVAGLWFDKDGEVFLTAQIRPAGDGAETVPQQLRILCNGSLLARYEVEAACEVTAIIPPGLIAGDRGIRIHFETSSMVKRGSSQGSAGIILISMVLS